jgi:3-hydroxyisobutyrate dehydrogenase-like beta-hydroxyacid dehydrogenase
MGAAVAAVLHQHGLDVITSLTGRSERTRRLAAWAGAVDAGPITALARRADIFLSIVPPAQATRVAREVAKGISRFHRRLVYVDFNAIAPETVLRLAGEIRAQGAVFVDGGIIGFPPGSGAQETHFWISGPELETALALREHGLDVRVAGGRVGQASALKMCYAAITKGLTAVGTQAFTSAAAAGLLPLLLDELRNSQPALLSWLERMVTSSPPKAYRWIAEMEEIARTFSTAGFTPKLFRGAADTYKRIAEAPPGQETPEERRPRSLEELAEELAVSLAPALQRGAPSNRVEVSTDRLPWPN